ncbi:MAG TPA: chemotaxis protein CheW [Candidatus Methanoperedens sp.]|nr:chemotaxis protein CheW [Candidatus Methanoperedens sp.]
MSTGIWERRREESERLWVEIRRRIEALERPAPAAEDLPALWHRRAVELAAAPDPALEGAERLALVLVRAGAERCALPVGAVREIQRAGRITPVSTAPSFVRGVVNLRGVVLAVLDLPALLGLEAATAGPEARILVVEGGGMTVGLLVERIEGIVEVPAAEVAPPLGSGRGIAEEAVTGIVPHGGGMVVLLDVEKVLGAPRVVVDEGV